MLVALATVNMILDNILFGIAVVAIFALSATNADYIISLYSGVLTSSLVMTILIIIAARHDKHIDVESMLHNINDNIDTEPTEDADFNSEINKIRASLIIHILRRKWISRINLWSFMLQPVICLIYYLLSMQHAYILMRILTLLCIIYTITRITIHYIAKRSINNV